MPRQKPRRKKPRPQPRPNKQAADLKAKQAADKMLADQQAAQAKAAANAKPAANQPTEAERAAMAAAIKERMAAADQSKITTQAATNSPATMAQAKKEKKQKPVAGTQPVATAPQPAKTTDDNYAGKDLGMQPIAAPPLPIPASKQQELQDLLVKYRADLVSPDEYQKERAAILAKP